MTARLIVYRSKSLFRSEKWRWQLVSVGRVIAESGEGYSDRDEAVSMARKVASGVYAEAAVDLRGSA